MEIQFNKLRDFVYAVNLDLPVDNQTIIDELRQQNWRPDQAAYGQSDFVGRYFLNWDDLTSESLKSLQSWSHSDQFRKTIIDQLYSEKLFGGHWSIGPEEMFRNTKSSGRFLKDLPGFTAGLHIDNRLLVASGMIYFVNGDDPNQSTTFYSNSRRDYPRRIPTGHGRGWIAANTHDSWHDGLNQSSQERYSMILSVGLKLAD